MKKIVFKKIVLENFLSFGKEPVEVDVESGITFITGINKDKKDSKNGVGKSALILESFSFALYGKTFRKINLDKISNFKTNKPCIVKLLFSVNDDEYEIVRSLNPTKLFLYKNPQNFAEKKDSDISRTVTETNKDILELLGISKEIFINTLVMTNRNYIPFPEQEKGDKTKFIEGILSLEVFSKMFDVAKKKYTEKATKASNKQSELTSAQSVLAQNKTYLVQEDLKIEKNVQRISNDISECKKCQPIDNSLAIIELENENSTIATSFKEKEEKINKAKVGLAQIQATLQGKQKADNLAISTKQTELRNLNDKKFECPTCKRPLDDCDDKTVIDQRKKEIEQVIAELKLQAKESDQQHVEKIDKLKAAIFNGNKQLDEFDIKVSNNVEKLETLKKEQQVFEKSQARISVLEQELEIAKNAVNPFTNVIGENEKKISVLENELNLAQNELLIAEGVKLAASPNGVKTIITKKIVDVLNSRLNYYLQKMNAPVRCEFDEFFEEKFTDQNGIEYTYGNLSGGEAKRIDFAMLLTFRDIRRMQSNISINITVLDEILDTGIDEAGITDMLILLSSMVNNTDDSVYIITHKQHTFDEEYKTIHLEKEYGISTIVKN
jgi:DNA repair exonuclease SbcCD ATPase subunit